MPASLPTLRSAPQRKLTVLNPNYEKNSTTYRVRPWAQRSTQAAACQARLTGRERPSDRIQVMLYMHLAPLAIPAYAGTRPAGCVVYNGSKVDILPEAVDQKFIEAFEYFLAVIAGLDPAWKVPSCHECRFCDIARTECPERVEG